MQNTKKNVTERLIFYFGGQIENIVGKGENAGYQHFLLFPQCFQKVPLSDTLKVGIVIELKYHGLVGCIGVERHFNREGHVMSVTHMCFLAF